MFQFCPGWELVICDYTHTILILGDFTVSPFSGAGEESLLITGWSFESRGNHANLIDSSMWDCKNQPIINKGLPHDSNDQPVINKDSSSAPLNGSNREVAYWISAVFNNWVNLTESAMCRARGANTNAFPCNWFDVIMHAVDDRSLQYLHNQLNVNLQR